MSGIVEIERKYIAKVLSPVDPVDELIHSTQAYVWVGKRWEWRIREFVRFSPVFKGSRWYTAMKFGNGHRRYEFEYQVPRWLGKLLMKLANTPLEKFRVKSRGWDIDVFMAPDNVAGLCLAEYETDTIHDPSTEPPAALLILEEVTGQKQWANKNLVGRNDEELARTIRRCTS